MVILGKEEPVSEGYQKTLGISGVLHSLWSAMEIGTHAVEAPRFVDEHAPK